MTTFEERLSHTLSSAYNIERELGGGGMSRVFVATDRILGRKIVIKVLSPELTAQVNKGRFRREMQVAAQLQHPHIVTLLSAGEQDDLLYFTMPFIKGESLKTALEKDGPLSVKEVMRILNDVGEALEYAHKAAIVHRDIKPANILMSGPYALITDFGVAKALNAAMPSGQGGMTATGMAIGTPAYMAPEQLAGELGADQRIDIYAVGLLGYELLHGRSPFAGTTPQKLLAAVLTKDPEPLIDVRPDVPKGLSDLLMKCLSKEPGGRPQTAREFLNALEASSSVSGEIRTMQQKIPHIVHTPTPDTETTPVVIRDVVFPTSATFSATKSPPLPDSAEGEARFHDEVRTPVEALSVDADAKADDPKPVDGPRTPDGFSPPIDLLSGEFGTPGYNSQGYEAPRKSRMGLFAGIVGVLALIALAIFIKSQKGGDAISIAAIPPAAVPITAADSAAVQTPLPVDSTPLRGVKPPIDSQALRDSIRRARRDSIRKDSVRRDSTRKAVAKVDEPAKAQQTQQSEGGVGKARRAAAAMLANADALDKFTKGATHMGGVLNTKRKGDLQTQIDALQPFLSQAGISYNEFKSLARESGVNLFDEFGRMIPDSLRHFARR